MSDRKPMDRKRLAHLRGVHDPLVAELLAAHDFWQSIADRSPVESCDVDRFGVTTAKAIVWLTANGWSRGERERRISWEFDGSLTTTFADHRPDQLAITIRIAARTHDRSQWDILAEMAGYDDDDDGGDAPRSTAKPQAQPSLFGDSHE